MGAFTQNCARREARQRFLASLPTLCPWCGKAPTGRESIGGHGHVRCAYCSGCLALNPHRPGTDQYEAWAVDHGNV